MGLWASEWLSGTGGGVSYVQVNTYADLPDPTTVAGKVYVVLTPSGVWPFNRKPAGMYYSDGAAWNYMSAYPGMLTDTNFGIQNAVDASKVMKFDASTITAPFTRTYSAPDKNGTLALLSDTGNLQSVSKSANYTASPFELVSCDISAGSFTVTFPPAPADKTVIYVKLNTIGTPGLNRQLTLATSGTDKFNTSTGNTQIYMYLFGEFAQCQYDASTSLWYTFISAGTYNVAIGNYAGQYNINSNKLYIDAFDRVNTAGDDAGALITGTFDTTPANQTLRLNASTTVTNALTATQFKLSALNTAPASAADTGTLGEIRIVDGFIYVCVATNTWQRTAIATW